jgi:sodium-dependent dicarboxylate transporter 2/3/5
VSDDVEILRAPAVSGALATTSRGQDIAATKKRMDWKRSFTILLGMALFGLIYYSPPWSDAVDPKGEAFRLTHEGKAALALFALTATWWIGEVIPIGVTSIAVGVIQTLFLIRPAKAAFGDYMDPSVCFILGSIVIGLVFTKTGLAKRTAYKMLAVVGERTVLIYLGCFLMTACLTLIMAHTAVAATMFPLLMAIYSLYSEDSEPTRFGKGLFIGMAFTAGAASIISLLGSARAVVALGFFKDMVGREITFVQLSKYMFPLGMGMVLLIWALIATVFRPERKTIPGLRDRARHLYERLGRMSEAEIGTLVIVFGAVVVMTLQSLVPALSSLNKSAVILLATVVFFLFKILDLNDLEAIPWNIILLFGGAMSIGFCLWDTGAAKWLAVKWLVLFQSAPKVVFILAIAFFVLVMTNFIMNVAAIAISLPVALVLAQYLGVAPEVILFASLATAGMPFVLLIGAAPNAIAYGSGQFKATEFLMAGIPASLILMIVLALFVWIIWPMMGMPVFLP